MRYVRRRIYRRIYNSWLLWLCSWHLLIITITILSVKPPWKHWHLYMQAYVQILAHVHIQYKSTHKDTFFSFLSVCSTLTVYCNAYSLSGGCSRLSQHIDCGALTFHPGDPAIPAAVTMGTPLTTQRHILRWTKTERLRDGHISSVLWLFGIWNVCKRSSTLIVFFVDDEAVDFLAAVGAPWAFLYYLYWPLHVCVYLYLTLIS